MDVAKFVRNKNMWIVWWQKRESEQKSCFICGWSSFLLDLIAAWLAARHNGVWIHCATWRRIMPSQFSWNVLRKNYASKYTSDVAKHNADTGTLTAFGHFVSNHWISAFCVRALCVDEPHSHVATEIVSMDSLQLLLLSAQVIFTAYVIFHLQIRIRRLIQKWDNLPVQLLCEWQPAIASQHVLTRTLHIHTHGARSSRLIQHIIRYANLCWMHNAITFA